MNHLEEVKQIPPFNTLPPEVLASLMPKLTPLHFPRGYVIFHQSEESHPHLFLVLSGVAEIIVTNEAEEESVIAIRRRHDFFGETGFIEKTYPATVKVVEDMTCLTIPFIELDHLLENYSRFSAYFSRLVTSRFRAMIREVVVEQSYQAFGMDSKPFRKRACDIMTTPVQTVPVTKSIEEIARQMAEFHVGSLVVLDDGKPIGIITERDLVYKVLASPGYRPSLGEVVNRNLICLPPDAYYYQVLLAMVREKARYICVEEEGRLLGIVALADLVRSRDTGALTIVDSIEHRSSVDGLVQATKEIDKVLMAMVAEKAQPHEITEVISEMYDRLTTRIIQISISEMMNKGLPAPPVPFCWLTMGSGGRKEQTLRTDQDNAIIFDNVPPDKLDETRAYFLKLAALVVEGLEACGFARCKGDVMASNPKWCRSLNEWIHQTNMWVEESVSEHVRMMTIFLDFRGIFGEKVLAERLRGAVHAIYRRYPVGLHHLAKDDLQHHVGLGFFRPFITEKSKEHKDEIDLKRSLMVHATDCVRIFALREGLSETCTLARIRKLRDMEVFAKDDAEIYEYSFETLMGFRIRENLRKANQGLTPDNYLSPYQLSQREQGILKEAIRGIMRLQSFTGSTFRVEGYL